MSSYSSRSTFDHDHDYPSRLPISDNTPNAITDSTPRRRFREVMHSDGFTPLGHPRPIPPPRSRQYPVSPRRDVDVRNQNRVDDLSRPLTRPNGIISSIDPASTKKALLEDRFEKMLALLDVDDSESEADTVDRRKQSNIVGDGVTVPDEAGHRRVCQPCLLTAIIDTDRDS